MKLKLVDNTHGYYDYDVEDELIHRACPGFNMKKGDMFNVYVNEKSANAEIHPRKYGVFYDGKSIISSLEEFKANHPP